MESMEFLFETTRDCWITIHNGGWPELGWWSYLLLVLLVATEGPISTLIGAAAAATGILDIRYVFVSAFLGNILGDCLWYFVGYVSDLKRIHRFGSWFGLRSHHVDRLEHEMHRHATKLIALSKLAIGLIIPTLIAAGLARVPWRRWFPLVFSIEILWTLIIVNLGFHGAGLIREMEQGIQVLGIVMLAIFVGGAFKYGGRLFGGQEASAIVGDVAVKGQSDLLQLPTVAFSAQSKEALSSWRHAEGIATTTTTWVKRPLLRYQFRRSASASDGRTAYKQLMRRFTDTRLSETPLVRHSLAARSAMTRAMAEGKSIFGPLTVTHSGNYVQEVHFAGD